MTLKHVDAALALASCTQRRQTTIWSFPRSRLLGEGFDVGNAQDSFGLSLLVGTSFSATTEDDDADVLAAAWEVLSGGDASAFDDYETLADSLTAWFKNDNSHEFYETWAFEECRR